METMISQLTVLALVVVIVIAVVKVFGSGGHDPNPEPIPKPSGTIPIHSKRKSKNGDESSTGTIIRKGRLDCNSASIKIEQLDKDTNELIKVFNVGVEGDDFIIERNGGIEKKEKLFIGRSQNADVIVVDHTCYTGNYHGELSINSGKLQYKDNASTNWTYDIDGERIVKTIINNKDTINLADVVILKFYVDLNCNSGKYAKEQKTQIRRW